MNLNKRLTEAAKKVARLEAALELARHDHEVAVEAHRGLAEMCAKLVRANAAKDAMLRSLLDDGRLSATSHDNISAALSDTAGEGWLPPEVREQAKERLTDITFAIEHGVDPATAKYPDPYFYTKDELIKAVAAFACAALDALKVK